MPNPPSYQEAVEGLLATYGENHWFRHTYWPENEPRIRLMVEHALAAFPVRANVRVFEIGCATGYVAYLFRLLGFTVVAVDAYEDPKRAACFQEAGIPFQLTNLNDAAPLREFTDASFDLVLLGEVFEHILNNPAGLLQSIHRLLRPGGRLLLTTPNPSTLANAVRVLRDNYQPWGTTEFLKLIKLDGTRIIDHGGIHYREYPAHVVRELLCETGFQIHAVKYVSGGVAPTQPAAKRFIKKLFMLLGLDRVRLFSLNYLISAQKTG